jgi:hypothetical protein
MKPPRWLWLRASVQQQTGAHQSKKLDSGAALVAAYLFVEKDEWRTATYLRPLRDLTAAILHGWSSRFVLLGGQETNHPPDPAATIILQSKGEENGQ